MMHPGPVQKFGLVALAAILLSVVTHDAARATAHRRAVGASLVRCTSLRQPARPGDPAVPARVVRFFAPTRQAVFFARAGDRCIWHPGTPARG